MAASRIGIVGGGIVGLAIARRLSEVRPDAALTVLDKEAAVGAHQTRHWRARATAGATSRWPICGRR